MENIIDLAKNDIDMFNAGFEFDQGDLDFYLESDLPDEYKDDIIEIIKGIK